jgi:transcriptional regulator with XRE-family HTH domain
MPNSIYAELGAIIRARRESTGMSQDVLASKVGLSRTSITNIERGRQSVLVHQLVSFAAALGVEPAELIPTVFPGRTRASTGGVTAEVAALVARLQEKRR